jgi:anti-sigma-K factor RskA
MNLDQLQRKLIAAARAQPPSARVPYAFEQRILAKLRPQPALDGLALWGRALWRAAAPCVAIVLVLAAWTLFSAATNGSASDLGQDLENTVLAAVNQDQATDSTW